MSEDGSLLECWLTAHGMKELHLAIDADSPAARGGDVEAIHQLRVATRRLRAALRLFAPVLPATAVTSGLEGLAALGRAIGAVRDLDVLGLAVAARARKLAPETRAALAPLEQEVARRRAVALAVLVEQLDSATWPWAWCGRSCAACGGRGGTSMRTPRRWRCTGCGCG